MSCGHLRDEGPNGYNQIKERKPQEQPVTRADTNPGGLSNIPPYNQNRKTHSDWCSQEDFATENRWTVNMPSFN
jgi:hypothetical protein